MCSQVKDLNDPVESAEDMAPTTRSLTSGRVSIRRGTTSKRTRGKKEKRTPLSRIDMQALAGASMEGISSEMIGALAKSVGKRKLVISASEEEEEEEGSSSSERSESVSIPSSRGRRKTSKAQRAHKRLATRDSEEEDDDEVPDGETTLSVSEARVIVQSCIEDQLKTFTMSFDRILTL